MKLYEIHQITFLKGNIANNFTTKSLLLSTNYDKIKREFVNFKKQIISFRTETQEHDSVQAFALNQTTEEGDLSNIQIVDNQQKQTDILFVTEITITEDKLGKQEIEPGNYAEIKEESLRAAQERCGYAFDPTLVYVKAVHPTNKNERKIVILTSNKTRQGSPITGIGQEFWLPSDFLRKVTIR